MDENVWEKKIDNIPKILAKKNTVFIAFAKTKKRIGGKAG